VFSPSPPVGSGPFGERAEETDRPKDRHRASARLNHWNASQLLGAGESAVVVAARLDHRDPSTTNRWYAHALPRTDARAATLMNEALKPKTSDERC
jgi:integrase